MARASLWLCSAALGGLVGCAPVGGGYESPVAAPPGYSFPQRVGEAVVRGQALWRQDGGDVITCGGDEVYIFPVSDYAQRQLEQLKQGAPLDLSRQPGFHKQLCDAQGNFVFRHLGAGDWYVMSRFVWYEGSQPQGGWLLTTVDLAPGEQERVIVTERNLYPPADLRAYLDDRHLPPPDYQNPDYPWPRADESTYGSVPEKISNTPPAGAAVTAAPAAAATAPPQPAAPALPLGATSATEPLPAAPAPDMTTSPPAEATPPVSSVPAAPEAVPSEPATSRAETNSPPEKTTAEPATTASPEMTPPAEPAADSADPAPIAEPATAAPSTEPVKTEIVPPEPATAPASAPAPEPTTASTAEPAPPEAVLPVEATQPATAPAATETPAVPDNNPHSLGATETMPATTE